MHWPLHSSITNSIIDVENDPLEFYYVCNRYKKREKKCRKKMDGRRVFEWIVRSFYVPQLAE